MGAYGGRRDIMEMVAPAGPMYQAGTLSGNPLAMTAGIETLKELQAPQVWRALEETAANLSAGIKTAAQKAGVPTIQTRVGTMLSTFFTDQQVTNWATAKTADTDRFATFFRRMLRRGVYQAPSQFEAVFISTAHGEIEIESTIAAAQAVFNTL